MTILILLMAACSDSSPKAPECPPCEAASSPSPSQPDGVVLAQWEADLLKDQIDALRSGVRPYGEQGWGVCTGTKTCETFLGASPAALPTGSYLLRAELAVPRLGEGWTVRLEKTCDASDRSYEREFTVRYAGSSRGYRLEPLLRFDVRDGAAKTSCEATLTPVRPDGTSGDPLTAEWHFGTESPSPQ